MKKKGFTLVELLAVIAILAILVIIALPNVMGMFNQARINSFTTEVKNILKQAGQQWVTDGSMNSTTGALCYARKGGDVSETITKELLLSGRSNLDYAVCLNKAGKITSFAATDDTYIISYSGTAGLAPENVSAGDRGATYAAGADDNSVSPAVAKAMSYVITDQQNVNSAVIGASGTCSTGSDVSTCVITLTLQ